MTNQIAAGRRIPSSGPRVRAGNRLPRLQKLHENEAVHANDFRPGTLQ